MVKKKSYSELLRDPRWQKKRLKVLERDNWICTKCGDGTSELNVHHKKYISGKKPWDYKIDMLDTLCKDCHTSHHNEEQIIKLFSGISNDRLESLHRLNGLLDLDISVNDIYLHVNEGIRKEASVVGVVEDSKSECMNGLDDILAMFDED